MPCQHSVLLKARLMRVHRRSIAAVQLGDRTAGCRYRILEGGMLSGELMRRLEMVLGFLRRTGVLGGDDTGLRGAAGQGPEVGEMLGLIMGAVL